MLGKGGVMSERADVTGPEFSGLSDVVSLTSAPQQIADHILSGIAVGALPEGTLLPGERALAADLQVSRSSVRAALLRLERLGVVERRRGRGGGTFVSNAEPTALAPMADRIGEFHAERRNLLDARAVFQNSLAATAALRRTDEELTELRQLAQRYSERAEAGVARTADAQFHFAIARAGHNPELVRMAIDIDTRINAGFRHDPFSHELFDHAVADHAAIVEAIAGQDAQAAGRLCEEHFRSTTMPPRS
ncbi:Transcriptional regulator, GntR family [Brevibacterium aurantiacum]|uniref:Transcriptional regulator, GntR family n=4 Tax=Brevibacterium TaxID=1696 RepID=A0A1D7W3K8_BREAU|nr:Transcriptional regulator, GntR family [Brevibacterium aurantiacum]SMX66735.1 transcriptional regulator, GntR family [Brevibacterium aurantiacum]